MDDPVRESSDPAGTVTTSPAIHRYWFIYLVDRTAMSLWLFSILATSILLAMFLYLLEAISFSGGLQINLANLGQALFFTLVNVYAISAGTYVIRRSQAVLQQLSVHMQMNRSTIDQFVLQLGGRKPQTLWLITAVTLIFGSLHNHLLDNSIFDIYRSGVWQRYELGISLGTLLTWFVLMHVASAFVANARLFAQLGREHIRIDLLNTHLLNPFGTIAWLPSLGLMGTQMVYPLMSIGSELELSAVIPGFAFTSITLVYLFIRPTWSLHKRLLQAKAEALTATNKAINTWQQANRSSSTGTERRTAISIAGRADGEALNRLQALLNYRAYIQGLSEWPFSLSTVGKWALYVIIPPLTWLCAALVEILLDQLIV